MRSPLTAQALGKNFFGDYHYFEAEIAFVEKRALIVQNESS